MEWQPIEEATKGAAIVFDLEKGVIPDAYLFDNGGTAQYGYYGNKAYNVTHFMRLPPPPVNVENKPIDTEQTK